MVYHIFLDFSRQSGRATPFASPFRNSKTKNSDQASLRLALSYLPLLLSRPDGVYRQYHHKTRSSSLFNFLLLPLKILTQMEYSTPHKRISGHPTCVGFQGTANSPSSTTGFIVRNPSYQTEIHSA